MRAAMKLIRSDRLALLRELARETGPIGRGSFGPGWAVLVNSPDLVQEVFIDRVDDFEKMPGMRNLARPFASDGLMISEGAHHRRQRRLVAPAFAHRRFAHYQQVIAKHSDRELEHWRDGATIDLRASMMRLGLAIIGETLFAIDHMSERHRMGREIGKIQRFQDLRVRVPFAIPTGGMGRVVKRLDREMFHLIRSRRALGDDRGDMLSMLLHSREEPSGRRLTDQEVRDEALGLFGAGHETTAQALEWSWYLLARHPEAMRRVRTEKGYALMAFKEAMRLYPPAYMVGRIAVRDTTVGGFAIWKGETLFMAPWLVHRDEGYFPDAERFDPERFRPEEEAKLPKCAFIPFGVGRRVCIANHFALMQGQTILESMAPRADLQLQSAEEPPLQLTMMLSPRRGIKARVTRIP